MSTRQPIGARRTRPAACRRSADLSPAHRAAAIAAADILANTRTALDERARRAYELFCGVDISRRYRNAVTRLREAFLSAMLEQSRTAARSFSPAAGEAIRTAAEELKRELTPEATEKCAQTRIEVQR